MTRRGNCLLVLLCILALFCKGAISEIFSAGVPKFGSGSLPSTTPHSQLMPDQTIAKLEQLEEDFSAAYGAAGIQSTGYSDFNLRFAATAAMRIGNDIDQASQAWAPDAGNCSNVSLYPTAEQPDQLVSSKSSRSYRLEEQLRLFSDCSRASKVVTIIPPQAINLILLTQIPKPYSLQIKQLTPLCLPCSFK